MEGNPTSERPLRRSDLYIPAGQLAIRPCEMGKIKIGRLGETRTSKAGDSYQQPEKLDHFIITHKTRDNTGNFIVDSEAMSAIGDPEPKSLRVFLPYQDPDKNLLVFYAAYARSRCLCRGNGEVALRYNETSNTYQQTPCAGADCAKYQDKKCKLTGILNTVLCDVPRIGGVHVFRTTSYYSISSLQASMAMLIQVTEGNISGVPLNLVIGPEVKQPKDGTKVTIYTVSLQYPGTIADLRKEALALAEGHHEFRTRLALAEKNFRDELSEVVDVPDDEDDPEAVAAEFYPPETEAKPTLMEPMAKAEPEPDPPATTDKPNPAPAPAPAPDPAKISEKQAQLFFARARASGYNEDEMHVQVLAAGYEHTRDIPRGVVFDDLLRWASVKRPEK